jgi:hypothetical protein
MPSDEDASLSAGHGRWNASTFEVWKLIKIAATEEAISADDALVDFAMALALYLPAEMAELDCNYSFLLFPLQKLLKEVEDGRLPLRVMVFIFCLSVYHHLRRIAKTVNKGNTLPHRRPPPTTHHHHDLWYHQRRPTTDSSIIGHVIFCIGVVAE